MRGGGLASTVARSPIGIDLGSRALRAVQTDGLGRVTARLCLERAAPDEPHAPQEIWTLADALERRGFTGRAVRVALPKRLMRQAMIDLPPADSGAPLDRIARSELSRLHDWPEDAFELAWWTPEGAGPPARGRVIAVCCSHGHANGVLDMFESAGLDVRSLTPGPAALTLSTGSAGGYSHGN